MAASPGPLIGVGITVALVALGLSVGNMAARNSAFLPLVWIHAILPGVIAAWLLFRPPAHPRAGSGADRGRRHTEPEREAEPVFLSRILADLYQPPVHDFGGRRARAR